MVHYAPSDVEQFVMSIATGLPPANPDDAWRDSFLDDCEQLVKKIHQHDEQIMDEPIKKLSAYREQRAHERISTPAQQFITSSASSLSASPEPPGPPITDSKTAIITQLGDPTETKYTLLYDMESYELSLIIQVRHNVQFTILPSDRVFEFSHVEQDGIVSTSDNEKEEQNEEEAGSISYTIDPPYWQIYREDNGYFAVPKTEVQKMKTADKHNTAWVPEPSAGDIFLALGSLVEQAGGGGGRTTRYVCALNLSTNPVSMWLIYDYRQPNLFDDQSTAEIPTVQDENYYLDCISGWDLKVCNHHETLTEEEQAKQNKEKKPGFMDQPDP